MKNYYKTNNVLFRGFENLWIEVLIERFRKKLLKKGYNESTVNFLLRGKHIFRVAALAAEKAAKCCKDKYKYYEEEE